MYTIYKSYIHLALFAVLALGFFALSVPSAFAVTTPSCTFSRDLQMGVTGDDVKCLQQYLNANGYVISSTGAGAPGKETGEFKSLTQAAVIKWQMANKLSPATGYFGPKSRQAYNALINGGSVTSTPKPTDSSSLQSSLEKQLAELEAKLKSQSNNPAPVKTTPVATSVAGELKSVTTLLRDAEEEVADNDDAEDYDDAVDSLVEARDYYYRAVLAYVGGDADDASDYLSDVEGYIEDALDSVGISSDKTEAEDALEEVKDRLDDAEDEVDQADEDGESTSESEDLLDEAADVIDEAETALDDKDYDEALDLIDEADDLIDDALDAIGNDDSNDVEDMLDDARDELDNVREDVDNAIDDGDDDEAEDLIDEALDLISDAEDEL